MSVHWNLHSVDEQMLRAGTVDDEHQSTDLAGGWRADVQRAKRREVGEMEIDDRLRSLLTEIGTEGVCQQMVLWVMERSGMTEHQARQLIGLQPPLLATVKSAAKRELGK